MCIRDRCSLQPSGSNGDQMLTVTSISRHHLSEFKKLIRTPQFIKSTTKLLQNWLGQVRINKTGSIFVGTISCLIGIHRLSRFLLYFGTKRAVNLGTLNNRMPIRLIPRSFNPGDPHAWPSRTRSKRSGDQTHRPGSDHWLTVDTPGGGGAHFWLSEPAQHKPTTQCRQCRDWKCLHSTSSHVYMQ